MERTVSQAESLTVRELIEAQNRRLKSSNRRERTVEAFLNYCTLCTRLQSLTDKQVAHTLSDCGLTRFGLMSPMTALLTETTQRLFRSPAGARAETEWFNDLDMLPECSRCGEPMLRHIGLDGPDYLECTSSKCRYKIEENNG